MARIVVELTNRCGLRCSHCFPDRRGGTTDLEPEVFAKAAREARNHGFDEVAFTGGEPTAHPRFAEILASATSVGYRWGMVTNGLTFRAVLPLVQKYRPQLNGLTFSLDGADAVKHENVRGPGSFTRVLQAVSLCVATQVPFTINTVITKGNRGQIEQMVTLAAQLGASGIRFGHLLESAGIASDALSFAERAEVDAEVRRLARSAAVAVALAPGSYTTDLFPCGPLRDKEVNIDCRGNLTSCCHLSGHGTGPGAEAAANLRERSFQEAYALLLSKRDRFRAEKTRLDVAGLLSERDRLPCVYCSRYYGKLELTSLTGGTAQ